MDVVRSGITDNPGRSRGGEGRLQVGRRFQGAGLMVIRSAAVKNVKFILLKEACAVLDLVSCVIQAPSCEPCCERDS